MTADRPSDPPGGSEAEPSPDTTASPSEPAPSRTAAASRPPGAGNVRVVAALVGVVGVLLLGVGGVFMLRDDDTASADVEWHGYVRGEPLPRPDFTLTDTEGRPYDFRAETEGRLTLLFFGYTSCPDVCPIQMATLNTALREPGIPEPIVVFVTTDPERDTPQRLRSWLDQFDADFVGLTGTLEEIAAAEAAAGVAPSVRPGEFDQPPAEDDEYLVGHSSEVLAYTPDDLGHLSYPSGVRQQDWMADLPRMAEAFPAPDADDDGAGDTGDAAEDGSAAEEDGA